MASPDRSTTVYAIVDTQQPVLDVVPLNSVPLYAIVDAQQPVLDVVPLNSVPLYAIVDAQQPVLDVVPLNTVPYSGPPISPSNYASTSQTRAEMGNVIGSISAEVELTGSDAIGEIGPTVRLVDIGESSDSYFFRVFLSGVPIDKGDFRCMISSNGKVQIAGLSSTGKKTVKKQYQKFDMLAGNLCHPGRFSISFKLPSPVNQYQFSGNLGVDGILEGIIKKI